MAKVPTVSLKPLKPVSRPSDDDVEQITPVVTAADEPAQSDTSAASATPDNAEIERLNSIIAKTADSKLQRVIVTREFSAPTIGGVPIVDYTGGKKLLLVGDQYAFPHNVAAVLSEKGYVTVVI